MVDTGSWLTHRCQLERIFRLYLNRSRIPYINKSSISHQKCSVKILKIQNQPLTEHISVCGNKSLSETMSSLSEDISGYFSISSYDNITIKGATTLAPKGTTLLYISATKINICLSSSFQFNIKNYSLTNSVINTGNHPGVSPETSPEMKPVFNLWINAMINPGITLEPTL